jgi:hypothetical protein
MKRSLSIKEMLERQQRLIEASHLRLETSYTLLDGGDKVLRSARRLLRAHSKGKPNKTRREPAS